MKNINELALKLAKMEKGKKSMSIAQIKELLSHLACLMKKNPLQVMKLLVNYASKK